MVGGETIRPSTRRFVLTHHAREPLEKQGGTTFTFVTEGIESALEQAKEAAGGKDVSLGGGAHVIQHYLSAGLVDELQLSVVPIVLGDGAGSSTTSEARASSWNPHGSSKRPMSPTSSTAW